MLLEMKVRVRHVEVMFSREVHHDVDVLTFRLDGGCIVCVW
jgi:hypothetical protein